MSALLYVEVPGYSAILFRRTYTDMNLPAAIQPRLHSWLARRGPVWQANLHRWKFPAGSTIGFGYLANSNDKYRYQSSEFQFIGFDELTQFRETDYLYLRSRLRRPRTHQAPLRVRAASNPGGIGHDWFDRGSCSPTHAVQAAPRTGLRH